MIGEEVRRRRTELGLTGAQLAARADMAASAVSQIETGKRTPSTTSVIKLANALGVEVADLFPKGQAPLPFEGFPEEISRERRVSAVNEAVKQAVDLWSRMVSDRELDPRVALGLTLAGQSLEDFLSVQLATRAEQPSSRDLTDLPLLQSKLEEIEPRYRRRVNDEREFEELKEHFEKRAAALAPTNDG